MAGRWQAHEPQPITHRQNITTLQVRQFNDRLATIARALAKARVVDLSDAHAAIERQTHPRQSSERARPELPYQRNQRKENTTQTSLSYPHQCR